MDTIACAMYIAMAVLCEVKIWLFVLPIIPEGRTIGVRWWLVKRLVNQQLLVLIEILLKDQVLNITMEFLHLVT